MSFYFYYQRDGKESAWELALSKDRDKIIREVKPAFHTALDLSGVPDDGDWSKTRYTGPLYFDFDADGDLELVCEQFRNFLGKLVAEYNFDVTQARFFASGSKGFHLEIPMEVFIAKPSPQGYPWLPYIYRDIAQKVMVDTLDLNVYTGKRGRQWRTTNVRRENGKYKVPLSVEEALSIDPDLYRELICAPREVEEPSPPVINPQMAMAFDQAKVAVAASMRHKKKRIEKANKILDPWRKAKRHPPTIEKMMAGEGLSRNAGFQNIALQLSIYAASVGMPEDEFIQRCQGLCVKHVSDGWRYGTPERRETELRRMWQYMAENSLYDFEVGPIVRLLAPGASAPDLGELRETTEEPEASETSEGGDGDGDGEDKDPVIDHHASFRRGVFMTPDGVFAKVGGEEVRSLCRCSFSQPEIFQNIDGKSTVEELNNTDDGVPKASGVRVHLVGPGTNRRIFIPMEAFNSSQRLRQLLTTHLVPYQGNDPETVGLMDILMSAVTRRDPVYTFPREGLSVITHPVTGSKIYVYLTQDPYKCPVEPGHPNFLHLEYRPESVTSSYRIDIHKAPQLGPKHVQGLHDLMNINHPGALADMIGWFVAAHYRSAYLHTLRQFPLLQVYGEAGSGKTQTVQLLAHLHWYDPDRVSVKSCLSSTPFALEVQASTSASAPLILDEYKPRELKSDMRKLAKIRDLFKMSYNGNEIAEKGHVNKNAETSLGVVKMKATAPIVFMCEAAELETAILERSVVVPLSQAYQTRDRTDAFMRLQSDPEPLSAVGRVLVDLATLLNFDSLASEVRQIDRELADTVPRDTKGQLMLGRRQIFNRAIVQHGLRTLALVLEAHFGDEFKEELDHLITLRSSFDDLDFRVSARAGAVSELTKVMSRLAGLSRTRNMPYSLVIRSDYIVDVDEQTVDVRIERAYDAYRLYCNSMGDVPLFDSLESFVNALRVYSAVVDQSCTDSPMRNKAPDEIIMQFSISRLRELGANIFSF